MTPSELKARVTVATGVAALALASIAAWLAGTAAMWGVIAGGALAVVNFRWLVAHAALATRAGAGGAWLVGAGLRLLVFLVLAGMLLATGAAHPVALSIIVSAQPPCTPPAGLSNCALASPSNAAKPSPTSTIQKLSAREIVGCGSLPSMMACSNSRPERRAQSPGSAWP
jgi:hypothetical protein